jgi:hypothetical protein
VPRFAEREEDKSMAEAGDTDPASLARRLNLTIPARVMLVYK